MSEAMSTTLELQPSRPARISLSHRAPFGALDREHAARRALNIVVAAVGLVVAVPIMLLIAALIKLTSRGPVLFTQARVGLDRRSLSGAGGNTRRHTDLGGSLFTMYKFRTMRPADANGETWAQPEDERVTPLGRVLRKLRLDELPQLFNVVKGDMSLVGPRPFPRDEMIRQGRDVNELLAVKPGITGYWQINGRSALDYEDRVRLDGAYVTSWSLKLDCVILAKTLRALLTRSGAY